MNSNAFDVNARVTKAFLTFSKGYSALESFCMVMNMQAPTKQTFHDHSQKVFKASKALGIQTMAEARKKVRQYYKNIDPSITDDAVLDIAVSYDGTWMKRGFTSNYGVGCVIHSETGLVIDSCVLSKFCRNCALKKK